MNLNTKCPVTRFSLGLFVPNLLGGSLLLQRGPRFAG